MKIVFSRKNVLTLKRKCAAKVMSRGASVRSPCFLTKMWQSWPRACPLWACKVQRRGDFCDNFKRPNGPSSVDLAHLCRGPCHRWHVLVLVWRNEPARVTASRHNAWPGRLFAHSWPRAKSARSRSRRKNRRGSNSSLSEAYCRSTFWSVCVDTIKS